MPVRGRRRNSIFVKSPGYKNLEVNILRGTVGLCKKVRDWVPGTTYAAHLVVSRNRETNFKAKLLVPKFPLYSPFSRNKHKKTAIFKISGAYGALKVSPQNTLFFSRFSMKT